MKITKRQLRRIIKEEKKALTESFNSMSPRSQSLARAAARQFSKDYPDIQVSIDGKEGWITVNGKKAVNMSQASGRPLSIEDIIDQMKKAYLGHDMLSQEVPELAGGRKSSWQVRKEKELKGESVNITKRQLRRIIREEVNRLNETSNWKPLSSDHAVELDPKTRPAAGQEKSEESIAEITKALYKAIRNRDALNAESTWDDDKLYIMTGEEQGITVQVLGRGRPRFGK